MSKLLINEHPLQVLPSLAKLIGLNKAIMLQQIHYWISDPRCPNVREGKKWHYDTYEAWQAQFPFFSIRTLKTISKDLRDDGLVITKAFNQLSGDGTLWYTIDYDVLAKLELKINTPPSADVAPPSCNPCTTPSADVAPPIYKEQRLRSETTAENNNTDTPQVPPPVVVDELFENGNRMISKRILRKLLVIYPKDIINEKLSLFRHAENVRSPGAWVRKALEEDWKQKAVTQKQKAPDPDVTQKLYRMAQENAVKLLEEAGILDPRVTGRGGDYDSILIYDTRLSNEIQLILNMKQEAIS